MDKMQMPRRALLIVNPSSRQGSQDPSVAVELLRSAGVQILPQEATSAEDTRRVICLHKDAVDCVVLGGGDGTLQRAAPALVETGLPLGILPLGTANDLARTLGMSVDLSRAAEIIVAGRLRPIDLGSANGALFFNVAHIGLGARLKARLTPDLKQQWGRLSYLRALIQTVAERRPFEAILEHGQKKERVRTIEIAVGNGRFFGGGMAVSEEATIDDALLDVSSIAAVSLWKLIGLMFRLRGGARKGQEAVHLVRTQELTVHTKRPMRVSADGEWATETPVHFRVLPRALQVYVAPKLEEKL
jgi:YegS/Rv2252/BmrU family lipid kinase